MSYCPNCGKCLDARASFCPNCGAEIICNVVQKPNAEQYSVPTPSYNSNLPPVYNPDSYFNHSHHHLTMPDQKKHSKKRIILICGLSLIVLSIAAFLIFSLSKGKSAVLSKDEIDASVLVGEWYFHDDTSISFLFNEDSSLERVLYGKNGQEKEKKGTWTYEGGKLILFESSTSQSEYNVIAYRNGYLYMTEKREGDNPRYGIRIKRAEHTDELYEVELTSEEKKLVGSWEMKGSKNKTAHITFYGDGKYREWTEKNGAITGSFPIDEWFIVGDYLILIGDQDGGSSFWHYIKLIEVTESYLIGVYSWAQNETIELTRCN